MPIINTFAAASARGFGFGTEDSFGEQTYTNGTYSFVVPAGVTSIAVVAVGGGGGGGTPGNFASGSVMPVTWATPPGSAAGNYYGGGGGALSYVNNISVTPGEILTVVAGNGGQPGGVLAPSGDGEESYLATAGGTKLVRAGGGYGASNGGTGGTVVLGTGGSGGAGGLWVAFDDTVAAYWQGAGGGGAGGYSGAGGAGASGSGDGSSGNGGGAGGGGGGGNINYAASGYTQYIFGAGGTGGGVGLTGAGSNGSGGVKSSGSSFSYTPATGGGGGSSGTAGQDASGTTVPAPNSPGLYGGGGAVSGTSVRQYETAPEFRNFLRGTATNSRGGVGAVRIVWTTNPSVTRSFPSTNVGNL